MVQQVLEAEMEEAVGAEKGERTPNRLGYRSGYYPRTLLTRVGKLELRVPQDRHGRFRTEVFERYQRSEKALLGALAEMYVQGVSTRKVKTIPEELCGHEFSASASSRINQGLDEELEKFACRRLEEEYPYVVVDARYEKIREDGVIRSQAVLLAIGINWEGRRCVLAVELANRESQSSWKEFLARFAQSWEARYPASVAAWRNHWNELTTFFKYPVELRRMIYTTNAIESLHSQMRKNIANRNVFPNDEAVIKILFLNLRNFANCWTKRQGWDIVMNQLMMIFGDRLKPDLVDSL